MLVMILCKTFDESMISSNAKSKIHSLNIMKQNKTILSATLLAFVMASTMAPLAYAQAYPQPSSSSMTLEEDLKLARERIAEVKAHPGQGSGTPYLDPNGVIGATIICGAIFGGIFVAFVVRAKQIEKQMLQKKLLK